MRRIVVGFVAACVASGPLQAESPPPGFVSLFNGTDLSGWRGRPHIDPRLEAAGSESERATRQRMWNADLAEHWTAKDGVIVNDGRGVFLSTSRDYGDFELLVDWKLVDPCGDSGIYLRGNPQAIDPRYRPRTAR